MPDNYLNWTSLNSQMPHWCVRDRAIMLWIFDYALHETSAHWIFRCQDDILINFALLPEYMAELNQKYDPLKEVVIRGDCVRKGPSFPQGGSGMLISRAALERIVPVGRFAFWELDDTFEDVVFGCILWHLKIDSYNCSSSAFLGFQFQFWEWAWIMNNDFRHLTECPGKSKLRQKRCNRFLLSTNQLVFFHTGKNESGANEPFEKRMAIARNLWNAPPSVAVWRLGNVPYLCRWTRRPKFRSRFMVV
jgi:hypothetical protein